MPAHSASFGHRPEAGFRRFTAYAVYPDDPADDTNGPEALLALAKQNLASVEEIDIDATTWQEAWDEAVRILKADYEPGGQIAVVREQIGWYR